MRATTLTIIALIVLQLVARRMPAPYLGFQLPIFQRVDGQDGTAPEGASGLPAKEAARYVTLPPASPSGGLLRSVPLISYGDLFELECAGAIHPLEGARLKVRILQGTEEMLQKAPPLNAELPEIASYTLSFASPPLDDKKWTSYRLEFPESIDGSPIVLEVSVDGATAPGDWFGVRQKVGELGIESVGEELYESGKLMWAVVPLALLVAFSFVRAVTRESLLQKSPRKIFWLLFAFGALVHFRPETFFYFDEFHVLGRFLTLGPKAVLMPHNEHFIPGFLSLYYLETRIFGDACDLYLLVTFLSHALNGFLLFQLVRRVLTPRASAVPLAALAAMVFVMHSVYAETMQWIFEQAVVISETLVLGALICGWDYIREGKGSRLGVTLLAAALAPLFFGNGFAVAPVLAGLALFSALTNPSQAPRKTLLFRLAALFLTLGVAVAGPGILYARHKQSSGNSLEQAHPFANPSRLAGYVFTGAELGTVLRGTGLFTGIELDSPASVAAAVGWSSQHVSPELAGAIAGFGVSLALLVLGLLGPERRRWVVACWLTGQWIIVSCLVLPSLGRWQLGDAQSLASRYHYATLPGLILLVLPAALTCREWYLAADGRRARTIFVVLGTLFVAEQISAGRAFAYFSNQHVLDRQYVERVRDWKGRVGTAAPGVVPYEGNGTALAGLYPFHLESITPGRHPNDIYDVMNWLNPTDYPELGK